MKLSTFNIFYSYTSLLPGDIEDCLDPTIITDPSCIGGFASVASVMRHSTQRGDGPSIFYPELDRESKFVQMADEGWGVNRLIAHDYFGWGGFFVSPSLMTDNGRLESITLLTPNFRPIMTNVDLSSLSMWSQFIDHIRIDEETRTAFICIDTEDQPSTKPAVESMVAALDYIAYVNSINGCFPKNNESNLFDQTKFQGDKSSCLIPVVHFREVNEERGNALLQAVLVHPNPFVVFSAAYGAWNTAEVINSQTLIVPIDNSGKTVSHLHVELNLEDWVIRNYTFETIDLEDFPLEYKDGDYIQDQLYLRALTDQAIANDPVVGTSGFMPLTRAVIDTDWRMCMGGECAIGNLFTDALRWASDSVFAVLPSGGFRGEGWEAGEVHVSDLWSAMPFVDYTCTGVMSGISVFRLFNYSTSVAPFESTYTEMGDRLLQISGMKMTYNTELSGSGPGRLITVDVWDREKKKYLPLERLKLYKFATDNWMCDKFDPYPSLFKDELTVEGEVQGVVDQSRPIQDIVGQYLSYLSDLGKIYDTSLRGSHINDTEALEPMSFIHTAESCPLDYFWEAETLTCMPCPGGKYVKLSEDLISFLITPDSPDSSGRNVLSNRELFNVTIAPKRIPSWIVLRDSEMDLINGSTILRPGDSVAIDFDVDARALGEGSTRSTVSFGVVLDGNYPGCLTDLDIAFDTVVEVRAEENFNYLGAIRVVGLTLMASAMLLALYFFFWTRKNRKHHVVQIGQPIFLQLICVGTFIMASTIIPNSIDDNIATEKGCDIACMASPWLLSSGFGITFTALWGKIWRISTVVGAARQFRRVVVRERDAMKRIIVVFTLNVALLLCWTFIDPMRWTRKYSDEDRTNSYGYCEAEGKASIVFSSLLIVVDGAALVKTCVESYHARNMEDEFAESRWIGVACASWIQLIVVGLPVLLLTRSQPAASYFTSSALIFLVCTSMLLLLFVPKKRMMAKPDVPRSALQSPVNQRSSIYRC